MADVTSYTPPEILNDIDVDTIHARMLKDLPDNIDQTEGGFAWDMTRPSAIEKADAMVILNAIVQILFPEWATGIFLDLHARRCGIARKAATNATGYVQVTGTAAALIPSGFVFCTPATAISSSIEYAATEDVTLEYDSESGEYKASVPVKCSEEGTVGNVPMDSIVLMSSPISGITEVTNPEAITGGTEEESDDDLRSRIMELDRTREASYIGNDSDYKRWAKEVDGVGGAAVVPEWAGRGTGTVKLIVMDSNGEPATSTLQTAVYNHIMGTAENDGTRLAPCGAILTVTTAEPMNLIIAASVALEDGYTIEQVEESFRAALLDYFDEAKEGKVLRYTGISNALHDSPGVLDFSDLTVNGEQSNIPIAIDDYPSIGELTLTEAEVE